MNQDVYTTDEATGENWRLLLGDSCERLAELPDASVDLAVYSPPFASLFTYSASPRDLGNCRDTTEFLAHYDYVLQHLMRLVKPGRVICVHCADIATTKAMHGLTGLHDLPGDLIRAHVQTGFTYYGRVTVNKNPQAQAIRTKSQALLFVTKNRDSALSRPAIADTLLIFRRPGENAVPIQTDVTNDEWIDWAQPVWLDVRETNTLNERVAREDADERHVCPLQLDFIERCVRLYSNPGETVLSPFAGIGSEGYVAVQKGRQFVGVELKPSYWRTAVNYLSAAQQATDQPDLFTSLDGEGA